MNSDELRALMEADELADATKLTPREYAKFKGIASPQIVYYHIRRGNIKLETCICGRRVLDVEAADAYFLSKEEKERTRKGLPTTSLK